MRFSKEEMFDLMFTPFQKENWQILFRRTLTGVHVTARKNGRGVWLGGKNIPGHVLQFCHVSRSKSNSISDISFAELLEIKATKNNNVDIIWQGGKWTGEGVLKALCQLTLPNPERQAAWSQYWDLMCLDEEDRHAYAEHF
jgi:hypothetical protein